MSRADLAAAAVLLACLAVGYLSGPAGYVRVTAAEVVVARAFRRYRVPREQVRTLAGREWEEVMVRMLGGARETVGPIAPGPPLPVGHRRLAWLLARTLRELPPAAGRPAASTVVRESQDMGCYFQRTGECDRLSTVSDHALVIIFT